jgi:hypothetical protein
MALLTTIKPITVQGRLSASTIGKLLTLSFANPRARKARARAILAADLRESGGGFFSSSFQRIGRRALPADSHQAEVRLAVVLNERANGIKRAHSIQRATILIN